MSGAPGWDAIDRALERVYGDAEPQHFGTVVKWMVGGPDPLDGVSVYARDDHWHFVSYGLTELYAKESDDAQVSGFGFELTFRLRRGAQDETPPPWAINFMQNLARYVFKSGNVFAPGHHLDANGPIAVGKKTALTAVTFARDRELPDIDTPLGRVSFVQIVGVTADEYDALRQWDSLKFQALLAERSPLLVTDLSRECMMRDDAVAEAVRDGIERDGSSMGELHVRALEWRLKRRLMKMTVEVAIGVNETRELIAAMKNRILLGKPLMLIGPEHVVTFVPSASPGWTREDRLLRVEISPDAASTIAAELRPERGSYQNADLPGVVFKIE